MSFGVFFLVAHLCNVLGLNGLKDLFQPQQLHDFAGFFLFFSQGLSLVYCARVGVSCEVCFFCDVCFLESLNQEYLSHPPP